ncbi:MAG: SNF2 family N-terminal domain-containing protein [Linnemannia gamsii]|nr:MAG: SNF2 family N-terminal domain-containing protein [Linnemannia gamsii]
MIQSLVVTLYPRHLEYIEGKADRVIIKRATTANKASLAVEHESGLYGYIVSELAETLVPLVDANIIWWEASVPRQRKHNNVSAPINIVLYGKPRFQMAVAKALYGKVKLDDPLSYDHRTSYSNPLAPVPGEQLSLYDKFRGATTPSPYYNAGTGLGYTGYTSYAGYSGSSVRSAEEIKNQIDGVFKGLRSATDLPEVEPASTMATTMYRHQKQALYFLTEREKQEDYSDNEKNKLTSLWRVRQQLHRHPTYLNVVTSQETTLKPTSMRGGILADDMGLGKTITVISLIMATLDRKMHLPDPSTLPAPVASSAAPDFLSSGDLVTEYDTPPSPTIRPMLTVAPKKPLHRKRLTNLRTKSHATLIICPLSTVQNWEEQFEVHVKKDALQVYVYHGGQRVSDPAYLAKHDVVITTYNLLGTEYSKECKGKENETSASKHPSVLQHIDWFRVVLDEAHIIKEVNTVQSKAACALVAERRWCLTGTPIQNKLDDLFALVKFLGMQPFQEKAHWSHYISKPIKAANPIGITRLQTLMKVITLRRTKTQMVDGKPLLDLPPRTDHMRTLDLSLNERQMYQRMESSAKLTVSQIVQENKVMKNYAHILQAILKLRQICAHYALVKNMSDDLDMSGEFNLAKAAAIYSLLQDSGNDQCNSCFHPSTLTPIVTRCEHVFCPECVRKLNPISYMLIQKGNANVSVASELKSDFCCPQCATSLRPIDLIQIQDDAEDKVETIGSHIHSRTDENGMFIHSTKVKALMEDLVQAGEISRRTGQPLVKSVVFSQWTSMLDLIEDGLRENKITFTRLDGTMQRHDRTAAMIKFKEKANCSVILISLKAGGVGLNLTSAQRVYLMDPHWNPSVESQAIDRIHRLGQTKPVDVVRFIIKESIEENILELQKRKTELSEMTFAEKLSKQEVLKRRLEDLKYLFQGSSELMKKRNGALAISAASSPAPS